MAGEFDAIAVTRGLRAVCLGHDLPSGLLSRADSMAECEFCLERVIGEAFAAGRRQGLEQLASALESETRIKFTAEGQMYRVGLNRAIQLIRAMVGKGET